METYTFLRELADSWVLLAMFAFFVGVWAFAFWPSLKADRDAAAAIVLRDDAPALTCSGDCAACACTTAFLKGQNDG